MNYFFFRGNKLILISIFFVLLTLSASAQTLNPDTVTAKKFDTGKMWTYDYPPFEYWQNTYDFKADEEWLNHIRLSTLRIPGCTASFASSDGLIITNHHCGTWHRDAVEKEGEDLYNTGFYAETPEDERKVPNMYADQLKLIKDVTEDIQSAMDTVESVEDKIKARDEKISELERMYSNDTGLLCEVKSYYGGGKYALHGFKRYTDVRLVLIGEEWVGLYGGDPDNFTYPRYNLDISFFRIYDDNGKPLKTDEYFKWNTSGVQLNDLLFISGSPGSTERLKTADQLEFDRDITYRNAAFLTSEAYKQFEILKELLPERGDEFAGQMSMVGNSMKVFTYIEKGLNDPYLIARKKAFDKNLQAELAKNEELQKKFGNVWKAIKENRDEARKYAEKVDAYRVTGRYTSEYFNIAGRLIDLAEQLQKDESAREPKYKGDQLDSTIASIWPDDFDTYIESALLNVRLGFIKLNLGADNQLVKDLMDSKDGDEAVEYVLNKSSVASKEDVIALAQKGPDAILNSDDPFIKYILATREDLKEFSNTVKEISATQDVLEQQLGEVMFAVYGTSIPPDANRSMRITDGNVRTVEYNGTIAPYHTTFYGLYNRYYSHDKKFPWNLPDRWVNYPDDFDLSTPLNFITDIDVIGGESGSPIINRNGEFVGIAFDGNIESIIGSFIYMPETNRSVVVAAEGILQALQKIYKADRIVNEIENGKIAD